MTGRPATDRTEREPAVELERDYTVIRLDSKLSRDQIRQRAIDDMNRARVRTAHGRRPSAFVQAMLDHDSALPRPPATG